MSIKVLSHVWQTAEVGGSKLLVLLALADFSDDKGGNIYPSMITLAVKARLSVAQTRRVVHELIEDGLLELVAPGGWQGKRNMANEYRIILEGGTSNLTVPPLQDASTVLSDCKDSTRAGASTVLAPVQAQSSSDPALQPETENDKGEDAPDPATATVFKAWQENIPGTLTPILIDRLHDLTAECGQVAVIHGIVASVQAGVRNFNYIATCARNHAAGVEPTRQIDQRKGGKYGKHRQNGASVGTAANNEPTGDDDIPFDEERVRRQLRIARGYAPAETPADATTGL